MRYINENELLMAKAIIDFDEKMNNEWKREILDARSMESTIFWEAEILENDEDMREFFGLNEKDKKRADRRKRTFHKKAHDNYVYKAKKGVDKPRKHYQKFYIATPKESEDLMHIQRRRERIANADRYADRYNTEFIYADNSIPKEFYDYAEIEALICDFRNAEKEGISTGEYIERKEERAEILDRIWNLEYELEFLRNKLENL